MEIDILEMAYELLDKVKYIVAAAVLGAALMFVYSFYVATPVYEASSMLYILNASNGSLVNLSDLQIGNYLAADYIELVDIREVNEQVLDKLQLSYDAETIRKMVTVENPSSTRFLKITSKSSDPEEAMQIANGYAQVISSYIATAMDTQKPNIVSEAIVPTSPVSPSKGKNIILGFLIGAFLAAAIVVVRFLMDNSIKSVEDVEKHIGLPVLAVVPLMDAKSKRRY